MNGGNWTFWRLIARGVGRRCAHVGLLAVAIFAWCLRRMLTPAAKRAGALEKWALERAEKLRDGE